MSAQNKLDAQRWAAVEEVLQSRYFRRRVYTRLFLYLAEQTVVDPQFDQREMEHVADAYRADYRRQGLEEGLAGGLTEAQLREYAKRAQAARVSSKQHMRGDFLSDLDIPSAAFTYIRAHLTPGDFATIKKRISDHLEKFYGRHPNPGRVALTIRPREFWVTWYTEGAATVGSEPREPRASAEPAREPWPRLQVKRDAAPCSMADFRDFLAQQSDAQGLTSSERDQATEYWTERHYPQKLRTFATFFRHLNDTKTVLTFSEMRSLAGELGIHAIMLDPLLSRPVDADCLIMKLPTASVTEPATEHFFGIAPAFKDTQPDGRRVGVYGTAGARYAIPSTKIQGTEAAFVFLELEPGHSSARHHHAGDELILSLNGTVTINFSDSGVSFELRQHSYVHFYSERNHSVINNGGSTVHLFIIRFYQFRPRNRVGRTRQQMRRELWDTIRSARGDTRSLKELTWAWLLSIAADRSIQPHQIDDPGSHLNPKKIHNHFGLARFLNESKQPKDHVATRDFLRRVSAERNARISDKSKHLTYKTLHDWLWDVETDTVRVSRELIPDIVELYSVFDLLVCEFLFPSIPGQVVVTREAQDDWADMRKLLEHIPTLSDYAGDQNRGAYRLHASDGGIRYEIPTRSLACSDVAISLLHLKGPTNLTSPNMHTGCEFLLPIAGTAAICYESGPEPRVQTVTAGTHVAHYNSARRHHIRNAGDGPATMFVIRFYLDAKS